MPKRFKKNKSVLFCFPAQGDWLKKPHSFFLLKSVSSSNTNIGNRPPHHRLSGVRPPSQWKPIPHCRQPPANGRLLLSSLHQQVYAVYSRPSAMHVNVSRNLLIMVIYGAYQTPLDENIGVSKISSLATSLIHIYTTTEVISVTNSFSSSIP